MGRPTSSTKASAAGYRDESRRGESASAMSLHSSMDYDENNDSNEELPPYTDDPEAAFSTSSTTVPYDLPPSVHDSRVREYETTDIKGKRLTRLSPTLTSDPIALKQYILAQSKQELEARIHITGSHKETHRIEKDRTERKTVCDFNFYIDVTDTISRRRATNGAEPDWSTLEIVDNATKTYRGSRVKRRDTRFRADIESTHQPASLDEWCHLFCASSAKCKTFSLRRQITARDESLLRERIESTIRATRYRGQIDISFYTSTRSVTLMSPHWLNRARLNPFIWWSCVLLQLWVFTWPILILATKRWDVLTVDFPFKKINKATGREEYVLCSEENWVQRFAYTISRSVVRRVGYLDRNVVKVGYLDEDAERAVMERREWEREAVGRAAVGWGVWRGLSLSREWQEGVEWGGDESEY